jgi:hypothetical protein
VTALLQKQSVVSVAATQPRREGEKRSEAMQFAYAQEGNAVTFTSPMNDIVELRGLRARTDLSSFPYFGASSDALDASDKAAAILIALRKNILTDREFCMVITDQEVCTKLYFTNDASGFMLDI